MRAIIKDCFGEKVNACLIKINGSLNAIEYADVVHRLVYIADEYLKEDKLNQFKDLADDSFTCLKKFAANEKNAELSALCNQFLEIAGKL